MRDQRHPVHCHGVSSCIFDRQQRVLYTAGRDASILSWSVADAATTTAATTTTEEQGLGPNNSSTLGAAAKSRHFDASSWGIGDVRKWNRALLKDVKIRARERGGMEGERDRGRETNVNRG